MCIRDRSNIFAAPGRKQFLKGDFPGDSDDWYLFIFVYACILMIMTCSEITFNIACLILCTMLKVISEQFLSDIETCLLYTS